MEQTAPGPRQPCALSVGRACLADGTVLLGIIITFPIYLREDSLHILLFKFLLCESLYMMSKSGRLNGSNSTTFLSYTLEKVTQRLAH